MLYFPSSNDGCLGLIANEKKNVLTFLDSVCVRPGVEERVFLSLLHTNVKKHPHFPSTKSIDKKEKFKVKHYAGTVTYTIGSFIPKNADVQVFGLEELLETSSFYSSSKCTLFADTNMHSTRTRSGSDIISHSMTPPPSPPFQRILPTQDSDDKAEKPKTLGSNFVGEISALVAHLQSTACTFIRCIKPNNKMTNGLFDPVCVVKQLRSLSVVLACQVLKPNLPERIQISEVVDMYCSILPEKLCNQLNSLKSKHQNPSYSFIQALMWALQIPCEAYRVGKSRIFFKSGSIEVLSKVMSQATSEGLLTQRLKFYITRIYFRKWMSRYQCERAWISLFQESRKKLAAASTIRKAWTLYYYSARRLRSRATRRKWRVVILTVRCSLAFMQEVRLLVEANEMRLKAQADAAAALERQEAELQKLIEKEEAEMMEQFEVNLKRDRKLSEDASDLEESMNEDTFDLDQSDEDTFPMFQDDCFRSRAHSTGSRNNSIGKLAGVAQRNASIANFGHTSVGTIAKSEMNALIAASSLATVSVCLFRWQNIKLFIAFETWLDHCAIEDDMSVKKKRNSALSRASLSYEKRLSLTDIPTPKGNNFPDGQNTIEGKSDDRTNNSESVLNNNTRPSDTRPKPISRQVSNLSKVFTNISTDNEDESDLESTATPTYGRSETSSPLENATKEGLCYECSERIPVHYCHQCAEDYCKVCSQFVHDYCKHMKTHMIVDIKNKPLGTVQMRPSFIGKANNCAEQGDTTTSVSDPANMYEENSSNTTPQRRESRTFKSMGMITGDENAPNKNHCAIRSCDKPATKGVSIRFCDEHYDEFRSGMKMSKQHDTDDGETDAKTLQQTIALLTKQLKESGQEPVEFVELCVARERMQAAVERLMSGEESAENEIERWDKAIKMNPDYQIEMEEKAKKWEEDQKPKNRDCYLRMRQLIPPDLAAASLKSMVEDGLPKTIANRIWTKKILAMICTHEDDIKRIHIVDLQTKYSNQGLDIVEMRAIWYVMPAEFDLDGDGKKSKWRDLFRQKLEELTNKEEGNRLSNNEKRNNAYKGHDDLVVYDPTIEIKKKVIAKSTAFDATEKPDINNKLGSGIKELRKQMGPEKPVVEGPLLYLVGGAHNADEGKKVYACLFRQKKKISLYPNADKAKEDQDLVEEISIEKTYTLKLGPGSKTFCLMEGDVEKKAFQSDKARREAWATALTDTIKLLNTVKKVKKKEKKVEEEAAVNERPPKPNFLDAIAKKGGAGDDRPPAPSFMDAIKNRKKAGDEKPSPPSFMDAIKNRKKAGDEKPAPPSFMDAIKNRKKQDESADMPKPPSFLDAIAKRKQSDDNGGVQNGLKKKSTKVRKEEEI